MPTSLADTQAAKQSVSSKWIVNIPVFRSTENQLGKYSILNLEEERGSRGASQDVRLGSVRVKGVRQSSGYVTAYVGASSISKEMSRGTCL